MIVYDNSTSDSLSYIIAEAFYRGKLKIDINSIQCFLYDDTFLNDQEKNIVKNIINDMISAAKHLLKLGIKWKDYHSGNMMVKSGKFKIIDIGFTQSRGKIKDIRENNGK